jgi:hypothetical protein
MSAEMDNPNPDSHGMAFDEVLARLRDVKAAAEPRVRVVADITRRTAAFALAKAEERRPEAERLAHEAADRMRQATETAKPQVWRLAHEARPRVEKVTRAVATFIHKQEEGFRRGAADIAKQSALLPFHAMIDALSRHKKQDDGGT